MGLPRIRGDRPLPSSRRENAEEATPHTRGSTWIEEEYGEKRKGYPAYAGIDPQATISSEYTRRLPRIRGDRPAFKEDSAEYVEATPHTRGSTPIRAQIKQGGEGYPAYAGIDLQSMMLLDIFSWLPRIRGDRPLHAKVTGESYGATPHTRGSTFITGTVVKVNKGYPAYAGIDPFFTFT